MGCAEMLKPQWDSSGAVTFFRRENLGWLEEEWP
jgi:hypothetical protein